MSRDKKTYDVAYHRARYHALVQLAREHPLRYAQLLAAERAGDNSPEMQAARRAVLAKETRR